MGAGLLAAVLIFSIGATWSVIVGILSWIFAVAALARMGRADPVMSKIFVRHTKYKDFYPARASHFARD